MRVLVLTLGAIVACSGAARQSQPRPARPAARAHTAADVRFMQRMIVHHRQADTMATLALQRSPREDIRLLAERIRVSQQDEIQRMMRWLRQRGEAVPEIVSHAHPGGGGDMPGMATPDELARLAAAMGVEFDRLFLELMIRHHEGALTMVAELFASEGAGREPDIFRFASDVDADQRAEIARMQRMQTAPLQRGRPT